MTVTLEFEPELEQRLLTQAREHGVSVNAYIQEIVRKQVRVAAAPQLQRGRSPSCRSVILAR